MRTPTPLVLRCMRPASRALRQAFAAFGVALLVAACGAPTPRNEAPSSLPAGAIALPASLAGTDVPSLPVDASGNLMPVRAVRDFFDYCLIAEVDLGPDGVDAFVTRQIAAQVNGLPAQAQALDVWTRYRAWFAAVRQLKESGAPAQTMEPARLADALGQREAVATQTLGEWRDVFFADEFARERNDIDRLKLSVNPRLSDAQRQARLTALERDLPADDRAQQQARQRETVVLAHIERLQKTNASPEQMRRELTPVIGPAATDRLIAMKRDDDAWRARYAAYVVQRKQIEASGQSGSDIADQVRRLREQTFTAPGETLRALSFDEGEARQ
ncbi:lipase secretion chaperone [Paraburkholderia unamae]|uniref:Lipase chaperone n=2 Tax=Paraburkholderia unamae TaxID=219649 RepID=A0ABX5KU74_9BURK|nr:lipase secretion chaperone [Paraburkholderia unamae]PVX86606.1 lipase chaperone LimK [Paraburkholderia unamae]CAG9273750.1 Lipase chaperone [Paraburkholderia unamae]